MRVKQTARKSTATATVSASASDKDAIQSRMKKLLHTKRKSDPTPKRVSGPASASRRGRGVSVGAKHLSIYDVKIKPRARSGEVALREIKRLQKGYELLIPRAPFHRVVRETTQKVANDMVSRGEEATEYRYQAAALEALQEATESFLVRIFEDAYLCTIHGKRVTLFPSDIRLCLRLQTHGSLRTSI